MPSGFPRFQYWTFRTFCFGQKNWPEEKLVRKKMVWQLPGVGRRCKQGALNQDEHRFTMMIWGLITGTWKPYHEFQTVSSSPETQTTIYFALLPLLLPTCHVNRFFLTMEIYLDHLVCMLSCVVKNSDKLYNFTSASYSVFACVYMFTTEFC